ncbi:MAG: GTP cyclohydrolase I FolE [Defluviitaleaceae bacterium]|nr:GTP cyclohydrolase I FolE [Defluviitaleaceae bacterium]
MSLDKVKTEKAIKDLLVALGEDPNREGLLDTPKRVALMYEEILRGFYTKDGGALNFFKEDFCGDMIIVKDIEFHSMCEHHLLPFYGMAHVCYVPAAGKLLGLSQLARVVELYAKRLQLQENMTKQIADLLQKEAQAVGVAIIIEATHLCMTMRGAKKIGAKTVTTAFRGVLKDDPNMRAEAVRLLS